MTSDCRFCGRLTGFDGCCPDCHAAMVGSQWRTFMMQGLHWRVWEAIRPREDVREAECHQRKLDHSPVVG